MNVIKKWLKLIEAKMLWAALAGLLPGVVVGAVLLILGLILLAPEPNVPPPHLDNSPGDVTIQLSQEFLSNMASDHLNGFGVPTPFGTLPLGHVRAQPQSGEQLSVIGDVEIPITGSRQVLAVMRPCVATDGRPKFIVTRVSLGDLDITSQVGQSIQSQVNDATKSFNPNIPNEHLSRILTTPNALILIYSSSGSGGQPAC
jgi:hypothetical protein